MMRSAGSIGGLVLGLLAGSSARAEFMNWSYSWDLNGGPTFTSGQTNVSFALNRDSAPGGATIGVGNLSTNSSSTGSDSFNTPYTLTLEITDKTTQDTGTLTFHGLISGTVGPTTSSLKNTFSDPNQSLTLDGHVYSFRLDPSTTIPSPDQAPAAVHAQVSLHIPVDPVPFPPVKRAPEPSCLLLAGLGLSLCGAAGLRRRRA
jgi:hypothetical protein